MERSVVLKALLPLCFIAYIFVLLHSHNSPHKDETRDVRNHFHKQKMGEIKQFEMMPRQQNESVPVFPPGYSTDLIEALHDLPRYSFSFDEVSSDFKPGQQEYWVGTAWVPLLLLIICVAVVLLCGVPFIIFGSNSCCGAIQPRYQSAAAKIVLSVFIVVFVLLILGILVASFVANNEANNEFIPIVELPEELLGGLDDRLQTIQDEAAAENITIPVEIPQLQQAVQGAINALSGVLPEQVKNGLDTLYDVRGYAFILVFSFAVLVALAGVLFAIFAKGPKWVFWISLIFFSSLTIGLCVTPLFIVDVAVADVCINSNNVIINPLRNTAGFDPVVFYLFCPENFTIDFDFLDPLINETQETLNQLEEAQKQADSDGDTDLSAELEIRIQQTQELLELEQNMTSCEETSKEYFDTQEDICKESLEWNYVLTVLLYVLLIFQFVLACLAFCAVFVFVDERYIEYYTVDD